MLKDIFYQLLGISFYSGYPGIIFYLLVLRFRRGNTKIVGFILIASFLADNLARSLVKYFYVASPYYISNFWAIIDTCLICLLFIRLIPDKQKQIFIALEVFVLTTILSIIFFFPLNIKNPFARGYTSILVSLCIYWCFSSIRKERPVNSLLTYPIFWINVAFTLYYTTTFFRRVFLHYLFTLGLQIENGSYYIISFISVGSNLLKNLLLCFALILVWKGYPDYITKTSSVESYNLKTQYLWVATKVKKWWGKKRVKKTIDT